MAEKKTPQDHKSSEFVDTINGVEIRLPYLGKLKLGDVRKLRKLDDVDQLFTLLEMYCDEDQLAAIDDLEQEEASEFMSRWQDESGVGLGESKRSSR